MASSPVASSLGTCSHIAHPTIQKVRNILAMFAVVLVTTASLSALSRDGKQICAPLHFTTGTLAPSDIELCAAPLHSSDGGSNAQATIPAIKPRRFSAISRFALAVRMSSLGVGVDLAVRLHRGWNLRTGVNGFAYHRIVSDSGIDYNAALRLRSVQAVVDWFPFSKRFHISPGFVYNRNEVIANGIMPTDKVLAAAGEVFTSSAKDPVIATAQSQVRRIAPMALFGFGNPVPIKGHFAINSDFGVLFQGQPTADIQVAGTACDVNGAHCQKVTSDKDLQTDLESGRRTMQQNLGFMRFYPVVSFSIGYHF